MSETTQVKVDNWGSYFLQRLKHFFNRTDYCDLTLQFQDNAQLKVHRLVLNACTEYFDYLERMCEMYEDCLIMPDDLQADVVVPIVNYMYTGQLEYKPALFEKLYQTAQIMNLTVLTKVLDAQRNSDAPKQLNQSYSRGKRPYTKTFESSSPVPQKKVYTPSKKPLPVRAEAQTIEVPVVQAPKATTSHVKRKSPPSQTGPTRYELPEELEADAVDESFSNISYESRPLMIHPQTKQSSNRSDYGIYGESSGTRKISDFKRMIRDPSTSMIDIVECKRINSSDRNEAIFDDDGYEYSDVFERDPLSIDHTPKDANQLFDKILNDGPKVTFETKDLKQGSNVDHAKIISEVLKKYPHLVKSNKNIKLKIVNASNKPSADKKTITRTRASTSTSPFNTNKEIRVKNEETSRGYTYETDVIDSKEAARLIAMGAENTCGPWICLICGTPGRALHFTTYYKFRRHLVEVHNEKPTVGICEYCGLRSSKRNYMLHHMFTKHGIQPPAAYKFPKCNQCPYVALTEAFLVKHKLSHTQTRAFQCNVCYATFKTSGMLLLHIQSTGHKISAERERKTNLQCIYCLKVFLRETNLYAHLKTYHKNDAVNDGIIENSEEEEEEEEEILPVTSLQKSNTIKYEPITYTEEDSNDVQYQIQTSDDSVHIVTKTPRVMQGQKQKILNQDFSTVGKFAPKQKVRTLLPNTKIEFMQDDVESASQSLTTISDEMVMISETEYVMSEHATGSRPNDNKEYIVADTTPSEPGVMQVSASTSTDFPDPLPQERHIIQQPKMVVKKAGNIAQPIQIVVSNEEEYKALMASNPSIIFDNGAGTIDLNSAQANDMMIIQQDYPLNVSEAVQTDNSNIVVVYSHPVDEQNKQYLMNTHYGQPQLITTQALGGQFVQSSAVLTQNYETITTSAPMVTGQVLVQQPIETWQGNMQQDIADQVTQISTDSLQQITPEQSAVVTDITIDNRQIALDNDLSELPDIEIHANEQEQKVASIPIVEESEVQQTEVVESTAVAPPNEQSVGNEQYVEEETVLNINPIESDAVLPEGIDETNETEKLNETEPESIENETPLTVIEQATPEIEQTLIETNQEEEGNNDVLPEEDEQIVPVNDNVTLETDNAVEQDILETETQEAQHIEEQEVLDNVNVCAESNEQIQNLTSEWSEDEEERTDGVQLVSAHKSDEVSAMDTTIDTSVESNKVEMEESIENIQQEMEKQMTAPSPLKTDMYENGNEVQHETLQSLQDDTSQTATETATVNGNTEAAQEKISSLLNDWEENDSQDSDNAANESELAAEEGSAELVEIVQVAPKMDSPKNENIRNLVSDWDEDEEEKLE